MTFPRQQEGSRGAARRICWCIIRVNSLLHKAYGLVASLLLGFVAGGAAVAQHLGYRPDVIGDALPHRGRIASQPAVLTAEVVEGLIHLILVIHVWHSLGEGVGLAHQVAVAHAPSRSAVQGVRSR